MHPMCKHPRYRSGESLHDIALVELKTCVPSFNQFRAPICLPESAIEYGENDCCLISGWGRTATDQSELEKFVSIDTEYAKSHANYIPFYTSKTPLEPDKPRTTFNIISSDQNCTKQYRNLFARGGQF